MGTVLSLLIVAVALFTAFALKKFYDKPYIVNFSLAAMLLLIVVRTLLLQPINTLGYAAIVLCSIAFIFQAVLGVKNVKTQEQA
ncbi:putative membrane protein [Planomicrobium sp. HSC-17F08]|nr:putative membrane protein [Planomicrobium sp. HSC-17F08]